MESFEAFHGQLTGGVVTTCTFTGEHIGVEVLNVDGAAPILVTIDGTDPASDGHNAQDVPAAQAVLIPFGTQVAGAVVKLRSAGTPNYHVTGEDEFPAISRAGTVSAPGAPGVKGDTGATGATGAAGTAQVGVNPQTGTAYTPVLADAGKVIQITNANPITLTVPTNAAVAFPVGTLIDVIQGGAGVITVAFASPPVVQSRGGLVATNGQFARVRLVKLATDTWELSGDLA